jgi:hypothetical protein
MTTSGRFQEKLARDDFFGRIGGQAVGTGEIDNFEGRAAPGAASQFLFYGDARVVADMLAGASQIVEDGSLPRIRITRQRNPNRLTRNHDSPFRSPSGVV